MTVSILNPHGNLFDRRKFTCEQSAKAWIEKRRKRIPFSYVITVS
jgi:hypothetical protein